MWERGGGTGGPKLGRFAVGRGESRGGWRDVAYMQVTYLTRGTPSSKRWFLFGLSWDLDGLLVDGTRMGWDVLGRE